MKFAIAASLILNAAVAFAEFCGVEDSVSTRNSFVIYNNLWGMNTATSGSQCTSLDAVNGKNVAWHTNWTWAGGSTHVKSFANANLVFTPKYISDISKIKSTVKYSYSGTPDMVADVAFDLFFDATSGSYSSAYEVMIWLAAYGGAGPISANGHPIATVDIAGYTWELYQGFNGSMSVFSFVIVNGPITRFSGDVKLFLTYLVDNQGLPSSHYLNRFQCGTEPFTGTNGELTVISFSATVS